jgi:long-chain acyl-CoA synthetase
MGEQNIETTRQRNLSFARHATFAKRFKTFILNYKSINTTNWIDKLAEVYGNFAVIHLDQPFDYPFMQTEYLGYRDILEFMNRAGNALKSMGVKKGDRIVLVPGNRIELGLLNLACQKIEAVPIPVNYMYKGQEIRSIVEDSGAEFLITDLEVFQENMGDRSIFPSLRECLVFEDAAPEGCRSLGAMMDEASPELTPGAGRNPRDVVQIFYSSGTTGSPKGALLTRLGHLYLLRLALGTGALVGGLRKTLMVTSLPLAHIMGMTLLYFRLAGSAPWYFLNNFDPRQVLELIQEKRAAAFIGVPAMYSMLLAQRPEDYDLSSIVLWGSAADAMAPEVMERIRALCPPRGRLPLFFEVYGQVESGGITGVRFISAKNTGKPHLRTAPLMGTKIRVVDESGNPVPKGEVGELEVKSPLVASGYWNQPEASNSAFHDGWLRTGDLAQITGRRRFEIAGRKSERIKCGGYSIFPQEVEEELLLHPEVTEAAVLGIPDPVKGQIPVAAVVLQEERKISEQQLLVWAEENIAAYKRPRMIKCLPELPRGATQKVLKKELEKLFTRDGDQGREDDFSTKEGRAS